MKSLNKFNLFLFVLFVSVFIISGCKTDDPDENQTTSKVAAEYDATVPYAWYELLLEIDRYSPNYRPPAAARLMAYVGLAAYETAVPGMPEYKSLKNQFPGLDLPEIETGKEYHWPAAVNGAYSKMFRYFYPHVKTSDLAAIDGQERLFIEEFKAETSDEVLERSEAYGKAVADAVYEYSKTDAYGHDAYKNPRPLSYIPPKVGPNGEKLWQPTFPDYTPALFPYWGKVRPFAMKEADLRAKPPIPYSEDPNSRFFQQAQETKIWGDNLSFEDRWVSEFWSDDFFEVTFEPAGRQMALANQMVFADRINFEKAIELYAKMGMALNDVAIAVWGSKYTYNVIRPIEYIRSNMDPDWTTALNNNVAGVKSLTPEFPAYPSGHSGFGGAGSAVLTDIFGNNRQFTDNCHRNRYDFIGVPRTFQSFIDAGVENAYSRVTLGVHFRMDCDEGLRLGYLAANKVIQLPWKK
ncbi:MAG: vanadium-dependent haloperoxidase [Saprospiraceae bacterium]|nr:vanadium-dependent haloperoxidase [Saprospiraceae bacterium]